MLRLLELTPAARPQLHPDETFIFVQDAVGLYNGKYKIPNYQNGSVYLTTHRACYVDNAEPNKYSVALDLRDVDRLEFYPGFLRSSPKTTFYLKSQVGKGASGSTPLLSGDGGRGSAGPPTPNMPSPAMKPVGICTWICPICTFSNPVPSNYIPQLTPESAIPRCLSCGITPKAAVLDKAALSQPPMASLSSNRNSPASSSAPSHTASPRVGPMPSSSTCSRCTFMNHPSLTSCEMCGARLISLNVPEQILQADIARAESPGPLMMGNLTIGEKGSIECIKFSFRNGGAPAFYEKLKSVMQQRKWLLQGAPTVPKPRRDGSPTCAGDSQGTQDGDRVGKSRAVGVAGLERQGIEFRKNNELVIGGAFEDLEALMSRAKEMVTLAESFATRLASQQQSAASSEATSALRSSTMALGLNLPSTASSTVTRDMIISSDKSSELYYSELARQIAEFLSDDRRAILKNEGGVITLVDLWATYNRTRGIDLISPADLGKATALFEKLKLPIRLRKFRSGLLVVQEARMTDDITIKKILEWMRSLAVGFDDDGNIDMRMVRWGYSVTPLEAAERFGWSVGVASEELEMAEERGCLCREVGTEGVRFWENHFKKYGFLQQQEGKY